MMTAQDYPSGLVVDQSGIDVCLVGDSLAMVSLGFDSTNPLTVEVKINVTKHIKNMLLKII